MHLYVKISSKSEASRQNYEDNYKWIKEAEKNKLVVGSKARILYTDMQVRAFLYYFVVVVIHVLNGQMYVFRVAGRLQKHSMTPSPVAIFPVP